MDLKRIADRARDLVNKRGGTGSLKEDAAELKDIASGKGSLSEKAKAAAGAIKDPGSRGAERSQPAATEPSAQRSADEPARGPSGGGGPRRPHRGRRRGRAV